MRWDVDRWFWGIVGGLIVVVGTIGFGAVTCAALWFVVVLVVVVVFRCVCGRVALSLVIVIGGVML